MSNQEIKNLHTSWLRAAARFSNAHQQLENELERMKLKGVSQEFIDAKDSQIESFVSFYNEAEELIQALRLANANLKIENHFLTDLCARQLSFETFINHKPAAKVFIVNQESGEHTTLSELPIDPK